MIKGASNDDGGRGATWQISWEATPHPSTGVLLGIHNAAYETRQQYLRDVHAALLEPDGRDTLADEAGFLSVGFEGPGLYKGEFNPGFQTEVRESRLSELEQVDRMERYAAALGYLLNQEAIAYHRAYYDPDIRRCNGGEFRTGRTIAHDEMREFYDALRERFGEQVDSVHLIPSRHGFRVLNESTVPNEKFHDLVSAAFEEAFDFDAGYVSFALRNGQVSNDWKEKPDGQSYKARYCAAGGPDLSGAVERICGRVNEVNTSYANQYGW